MVLMLRRMNTLALASSQLLALLAQMQFVVKATNVQGSLHRVH